MCFCLNVNNLCVRDVFLRTHSNTDTGLTNTYTIAVADPHLQISGRGGGGGGGGTHPPGKGGGGPGGGGGGGGGGGHPDPEIRGRRPCGGGFHCTNFTHSS